MNTKQAYNYSNFVYFYVLFTLGEMRFVMFVFFYIFPPQHEIQSVGIVSHHHQNVLRARQTKAVIQNLALT